MSQFDEADGLFWWIRERKKEKEQGLVGLKT